ncbi:unnamed protein product [Anisakis simplex]|uniref:THO complex subunitTHOC2 C-terminal domain-containing protein n=1 Tax=Anisakis simplex TaxID=6269 RepID=A0A3P6RJA2_ANISI|nr:unnamed protein product [Anisakis simplex]
MRSNLRQDEYSDRIMSIDELISKYYLPTDAAVFIIFWTLTMYDISVPKAAYEKEIQRVRRSLATLADNVEISKTKRAKEEEQLKGVEKKLSDELKKQNDHVERILAILRHDKELLFADCAPNMRGMQMARFLQYCILPRAVFTDIDAVYCAHFVHLLHQQRTGFFQTVFFFDKLFNDIAIILTAFTENEANCFGRFLSLMLEIVQRWHGDKSVFEKECHGFPGFMTKLHTRNAEGITESHNGGMNFESYRSLCHKWQFRMARSSVAIMNGGNYVLMRNCLIVMTKVLQYFPLIESHVGSIQKVVMKVRDSEKGNRDDLSLMAASYASHLQMRKTSVFTEAQFHNRSALTAKKTTTQKVTVSKASSNEVTNNPKAQQQQQSESVAKKVTVKGTESSDSKKANDSEASGKRDGGTEAADAASTKQRTTTSVNGELAVKSSTVNSSSANRNTTTTASKSSSSSDHGKSSASQISSNDPKNDAISSKSGTASTNADERKRASTTNVTVKNDSPAHKKNKVSSNSTEVTVSSKNSSSKNVETRHNRESNSQTNKTASKEEQKMEEGEVCASPPSSSSTHHSDSGHTSKKVGQRNEFYSSTFIVIMV